MGRQAATEWMAPKPALGSCPPGCFKIFVTYILQLTNFCYSFNFTQLLVLHSGKSSLLTKISYFQPAKQNWRLTRKALWFQDISPQHLTEKSRFISYSSYIFMKIFMFACLPNTVAFLFFCPKEKRGIFLKRKRGRVRSRWSAKERK